MANKTKKGLLVGFIGQGFVGKNLADNFEHRGYKIVRYSLEKEYVSNKDRLKDCDIVFISVPTPTVPEGFDSSILNKVISLVGDGKVAVIKSTVIPGTTANLQKKNKNITLLHSPEFLSEASARRDTDYPFMNIIGMSQKSDKHLSGAKLVSSILPESPFSNIVLSNESELIKYAHNCAGFVQIVFFNMLYDLAKKLNADWANVESAIKADPYIPNRYSNPLHKKGRGAGGNCFIKDFEAFIEVFSKTLPKESKSIGVLKNIREKNIELLLKSGKDLDLLQGVYGKKIYSKLKK